LIEQVREEEDREQVVDWEVVCRVLELIEASVAVLVVVSVVVLVAVLVVVSVVVSVVVLVVVLVGASDDGTSCGDERFRPGIWNVQLHVGVSRLAPLSSRLNYRCQCTRSYGCLTKQPLKPVRFALVAGSKVSTKADGGKDR